jgi:hypothetical protein
MDGCTAVVVCVSSQESVQLTVLTVCTMGTRSVLLLLFGSCPVAAGNVATCLLTAGHGCMMQQRVLAGAGCSAGPDPVC